MSEVKSLENTWSFQEIYLYLQQKLKLLNYFLTKNF